MAISNRLALGGVIVVVLGYVGYRVLTAPKGLSADDEIPVKLEPIQESLADAEPFTIEADGQSWTVTPKAKYRIAARVLSSETYSHGWQSSVSPLDLALGWGSMANPNVDEWITWSQFRRWYEWKWKADSPYQNEQIRRRSANVHIIPATTNLERALIRRVDEGDEVLLEGLLVFIKGGDHWWNSSLTRTDTGNSSCEVLYVERLVVDGKAYE